MGEKKVDYDLEILVQGVEFFQNWFESQFPVKCLEQIFIIEDVLKVEDAQRALECILESKFKAKFWLDWQNTIQDVLSECFTKKVVIELFANTISSNTYDILTFKNSKIIECLKNAIKPPPKNDEIITDALKMWYMNAIRKKITA